MELTVYNQQDTRSGFGAGLAEAGKLNPNVVALCADLTGSLKMDAFKKAFPDRFFQVGIAEANMMSMAAGMTIGGKIPFTGTFANFSTGRVYDQIRQSIAYSGKNVKICASHAGVTLGEDGATHQILEDIGLMRMLPGMTVIVPCDYNQTKAATLALARHEGPASGSAGQKSQTLHLKISLLLSAKLTYCKREKMSLFLQLATSFGKRIWQQKSFKKWVTMLN
jgi:transketolase C-terminal domain/subunit